MPQAGQPHRAQAPEKQSLEIAPLVSVTKSNSQYFLSQPLIQLAQLFLVVHVFQVIINNGNRAEPILHHVTRDIRSQLCAGLRLLCFAEALFFAAKGKAELVANLATLFACHAHAAVFAELQSQMLEPVTRIKGTIGMAGGAGEEKIAMGLGLAGNAQFFKRITNDLGRS